MKVVFVMVCALLFSALQAPAVYALNVKETREKAARYYEENEFKKAYKTYSKLAKKGDHYSQNKLSQMIIDGKGHKVDLNEAYAWSVLAAESGVEGIIKKSDELLLKTPDQEEAKKRAEKLKNKYGRDALLAKVEKREQMKYSKKSGGCTGSKIGCSR